MKQKMLKEIKKTKRVEELEYFPFENLAELKKARREGIANICINRMTALEWGMKGHGSLSLRTWLLFLTYLPFIVVIGFVAYVIITSSWLLFLALPIFVICYIMFHPGLLGFPVLFRLVLVVILVCGLIYEINWLIVFTLPIIIIGHTQCNLHTKAINELATAALEHEDLLCFLWSIKALDIMFFNGNRYWSDCKREDGKFIYYNDK